LAKNDEGEFELILGNRQLISVFLIVVILLGVFFSMGYIVGRNSAPAVETARESKPVEVHWPAADAGKSPDAVLPDSPAVTPSDTTQAKPSPPETTAAETQPPAPAPVPAAQPPATKEKPRAVGPPVSAPATAPVNATASASEPAPGNYWQVVATARPEAEIVAETLGKKGFHAVVAPASRDGIFRVLVGPLKDAGAQAQTRTALEAAGFKPIRRKY
jgi:SPOR domain